MLFLGAAAVLLLGGVVEPARALSCEGWGRKWTTRTGFCKDAAGTTMVETQVCDHADRPRHTTRLLDQ